MIERGYYFCGLVHTSISWCSFSAREETETPCSTRREREETSWENYNPGIRRYRPLFRLRVSDCLFSFVCMRVRVGVGADVRVYTRVLCLFVKVCCLMACFVEIFLSSPSLPSPAF